MTGSTMTRAGKRTMIIGTAAAAAAVGVLAVPAQASSWTSYLSNAGSDFESRRWTDNGGSTTIKFTSCHRDGTQAVSVMLRKDTFGPDPKYANASFTNCFNPGATSTGNWGDHGSGDYYFVIDYGTNMYAPVSVSSLTVYY
ncbi:hypothetical protein ACFQE4_13965 [Streptomyces thermocoprophilus]|uniref:Secreted protein n=1 Tax=Streptomyces thermocoprophilus TaxID=78356 RepID=A0ABV5VND5_9ACTN